MSRLKMLIAQFNWKIVLIRILVNSIVITVTVAVLPDVYFATPKLTSILVIAITLGILNAIVKPVILLLTGQFIFATFGLVAILVNTLILYLLERLFPTILVINSFWWALAGSAILSLLSNALENLMGITAPIVPDEETALRRRIAAEQQVSLVNLMTKTPNAIHADASGQDVSEVAAARAVLDTLQPPTKNDTAIPPGNTATPKTPGQGSEPADEQPQEDTSSENGDDRDPEDTTGEGGAA